MTVDILLFTSTHCPHCAALVDSFRNLQQQKLINEFSVIDIEQHPEQAAEYQIRSVPWFRIGELEFFGAHTPKELEYWVRHANTEEGIRQYIIQQLETGQLKDTERQFQRHPDWLNISVTVLGDMESPLQARIGISAIIESMAGSPLLDQIIQPLGNLVKANDARVRGDVCHLLGFINHADAKKLVRECLHDPDPEVREIAEETIADSPF